VLLLGAALVLTAVLALAAGTELDILGIGVTRAGGERGATAAAVAAAEEKATENSVSGQRRDFVTLRDIELVATAAGRAAVGVVSPRDAHSISPRPRPALPSRPPRPTSTPTPHAPLRPASPPFPHAQPATVAEAAAIPLIPHVIHQTWKTHDLPAWSQHGSWQRLNPSFAHVVWSDADVMAFLRLAPTVSRGSQAGGVANKKLNSDLHIFFLLRAGLVYLVCMSM
jgi:hypothetical protein